jgi:hypothetical protein
MGVCDMLLGIVFGKADGTRIAVVMGLIEEHAPGDLQ